MRKVALFAVIIGVSIILLHSASASEPRIPLMKNPYLILFTIMFMALFLFYEQHLKQTHVFMNDIIDKYTNSGAGSIEYQNAVKKNPTLEMQYSMVGLVRDQIITLLDEGKSQGEIVKSLKKDNWDSQVIFIALNRINKE